MTRPTFAWNQAALAATTACLVSVLILTGVNFWLTIALASCLLIVWTIVGIVVDEIRRRKEQRS